jgi:hydrogenase maturation protein HypF
MPTRFAHGIGCPVIPVQHHYAHVLACMADNEVAAPALGFAWDGTGWGPDGTVWGGEALRITESGFERVAWLRPFPLPGGDTAVREPRRAALGAVFEAAPDAAETVGPFSDVERRVLLTMLRRGVNVTATSSAGRLFDAVAALLGLAAVSRFEGEAALALEFAARGSSGDEVYPFEAVTAPGGDAWSLDWRPMIRSVHADQARGVPRGDIALRFHNTLVEMIVDVAQRCALPAVLLSGGCFQNRRLTERAVARLREEGFQPYWHRRIPPGDGGLAVGQILAAGRVLAAGG